MEGRKLALTTKVSLDGAHPDWKGCYVEVTQASSAEHSEVMDYGKDDHTNAEATAKMVEQVKNHFVGGKLKLIGQDGLQDMSVSDVDLLPDRLLYDVWAAVNGFDFDPKDLSTVTEISSEPEQPTSEHTNEVTPSTTS